MFCYDFFMFISIPILLEKSTLSPPTTSKPKEIATEKPQCDCQCPKNNENNLSGGPPTKMPDPPAPLDG